MNKLPQKCVEIKKDKIILVSEKGRKFQLNNISRHRIKVVEIDGCVILEKDNQKACDYAMIIEAISEGLFIELKGRNIKHACSQLLLTIKYFKEQKFREITAISLFAVIVSSKSKVPKLKQFPDYVRLRKIVQEVWIKNNQLVIDR